MTTTKKEKKSKKKKKIFFYLFSEKYLSVVLFSLLSREILKKKKNCELFFSCLKISFKKKKIQRTHTHSFVNFLRVQFSFYFLKKDLKKQNAP